MIGIRDHLTHFVEKETHIHVFLGDDAIYNVRGVGTSTFQLDSYIHIQLKEVPYVPKMNISLSFCLLSDISNFSYI
jgi:hypothetical protein